MAVQTSVDLRNKLIEEIRLDLVGPRNGEEERLDDPPVVEYLTGILYPANSEISPEEDEKLEVDDVEDDEDADSDVIILSQTMNPASLGLSFAIESFVDQLNVEISYGIYEQCGAKRTDGWQRHQVKQDITLRVKDGLGKILLPNKGSLEWVIRPYRGVKSVSLFLVNRNSQPDQSSDVAVDKLCLFQPCLRVRGPQNTYPFIHRNPESMVPLDTDLESHELLYSTSYEFATGHGCAVNWDMLRGNRAGFLETTQIPSFEVSATVPNDIPGLDMKILGESDSPEGVASLLMPVTNAYEGWINERRSEIPHLASEKLRSTATTHLMLCMQALDRMRSGLKLLCQDQQIFEAFRFANRAMLLQRSYSKWALAYRRTGRRETTLPEWEGHWRPFQIAFILLNLSGVSSPESADRDVVDLLWFPTGGGKTEAYLGLIAFTLALRRLKGEIKGMNGDGGVTVIMRYTLRLLTTQQFQRAATLICACEYLRRRYFPAWGKHPFQIGLWVGSSATPNNLQEAEEKINTLKNGAEVREGNPVQLTFCPWCGEALSARDYHIIRNGNGRKRMVVVCPREKCLFHIKGSKLAEGKKEELDKSIPALLVDEDIYHQCPSLLLATVDKFARLPWLPQTMALFGRVDRYCPEHGFLVHSEDHAQTHRTPRAIVEHCRPFLPPELIIQDELHLISGPLGTLAGLYETAIDLLCTYKLGNKEVKPKIIASTATIRRAVDQVNGLFARDVRLFPPSGINSSDSFFAQAQPSSLRPGRYYVGVCAPGRSIKTALVRVYAILLQVAGEQLADYGSLADPYYTLLGYFNSLRELGGALRLVEDDIVQRMKYLAQRRERKENRRAIKNEDRELTSRVPSYKIPEILSKLELSAGNQKSIDVLLATNMISVGMDIDRLGLMVVNGQPKTSAEYIQATSRVGRQPQAPGLVITVYNWSRPRDISHYEGFRTYHEAIYRHVEATSVTPFASRARDRGLHAVLIALARIMREQWTSNTSPSRFDPSSPLVAQIKSSIIQRVSQIDTGSVVEVEQHLDALIGWWSSMILRHGSSLCYVHYNYREPKQEMMHAAEVKGKGGSRATLNSLREVEGESWLYIDWSN